MGQVSDWTTEKSVNLFTHTHTHTHTHTPQDDRYGFQTQANHILFFFFL